MAAIAAATASRVMSQAWWFQPPGGWCPWRGESKPAFAYEEPERRRYIHSSRNQRSITGGLEDAYSSSLMGPVRGGDDGWGDHREGLEQQQVGGNPV
jgi:hypothetical protein